MADHPTSTIKAKPYVDAGDAATLAAAQSYAANASNLTSGTIPNARIVALPNANLAFSAITLNTHAVSLGGSLSLTAADVGADASGAAAAAITTAASAAAGLYLPLAGGTLTGALAITGHDATINGLTFGKGAGSLSDNTAAGYLCLSSVTSGSTNAAFGFAALYQNSTGIGNMAIGANALYSNINGNTNVAIGSYALLANIDGSSNTAIGGSGALVANTHGSVNTALGYNALAACVSGNQNIGLGYSAGSAITGSYNVILGSAPGVAGTSNHIIISDGAGNIGVEFDATQHAVFPQPIATPAYVVASLPTGIPAYSRAFVTNATLPITTGLGLAPIGGGTNKVPVYTVDGTNWLIG